ncbi:MAG: archease [Candidatus Omnitrophota bacterium]
MKNYELLEHTADIKILVKARDLQGLFENSALAMFDIMGQLIEDLKQELEGAGLTITQNATDIEELLINWLNELLSLSAVNELFFTDFKIYRLDRTSCHADIYGEDIKNYKINTEIKAATYHELKIKENKDGWTAEIVFDV